MDKQAIVAAVVARLRADFETLRKAADETRATANDDESRSEGKYDTRSTESGYLANGQARHAATLKKSLEAIELADWSALNPGAPVALGALLEIDFPGSGPDWFILAPGAGGIEVEHDGRSVTVITPVSPLAQQLLGKTSGTTLERTPATLVNVS